jgi:enoyl-CoA hydratase
MNSYQRFAKDNFLIVDIEHKVAKITINRPERMNSIIPAVHHGLEELFLILSQDTEVNAIVLTGAGDRAFCAGADVKEMASRPDRGEVRHPGYLLTAPKRLIHNFLNIEQPVIAAINGHAIGLGATLALMSDITIMSDKALIADTHVNVGLVAGDGGTLIWPLLVGINRAKELLMTGRKLDAEEAKRIGLVNHVVPQDQVLDEALRIARELADGAPMAVRWTKASLNQILWQQISSVFHFSLATEAISMGSHDHIEGAKAFSEKRSPRFTNT